MKNIFGETNFGVETHYNSKIYQFIEQQALGGVLVKKISSEEFYKNAEDYLRGEDHF